MGFLHIKWIRAVFLCYIKIKMHCDFAHFNFFFLFNNSTCRRFFINTFQKNIFATLFRGIFLYIYKVRNLNKHFCSTLLRGINPQSINKSIDFKRGRESTCVGVSRNGLYKKSLVKQQLYVTPCTLLILTSLSLCVAVKSTEENFRKQGVKR